MTTQPMKPPKIQVLRHLLERGSVFVHLDPRRKHVIVPAKFHFQTQVVLQIGLHMPVPIVDLRVDAEGIFGTLSFGGVPFSCFVPWQAVFAMVGESGKGCEWDEDFPLEFVDSLKKMRDTSSIRASSETLPPSKPEPAVASVTRLDAYRRQKGSLPRTKK